MFSIISIICYLVIALLFKVNSFRWLSPQIRRELQSRHRTAMLRSIGNAFSYRFETDGDTMIGGDHSDMQMCSEMETFDGRKIRIHHPAPPLPRTPFRLYFR